MDVELHETDISENARDSLNGQGVYIYKPVQTAKALEERSPKRRKVSKGRNNQVDEQLPFVPLLEGEEIAGLVQLRHSAFRQVWSWQEEEIEKILEDVDSAILQDVASFIRTASPQTCHGCIPTALISIGSNASSLSRLLDRLNHRLTSDQEGGVVVVESGDAPNLKTALKNIIRAAISNSQGNEGYQDFLVDRSGPRLLSYDLDLLHDYVKRQEVKKLTIAFRDSEAFDPGLLSDLLSLLSSWLDRIPFILLFGIATSFELFEGRLPRSSVALLHGKHFEINNAGDCIDRIYEMLQVNGNSRLWLGQHISRVLFEKSRDYFQSPETFGRMVKYAYMSHFFANPLSVLLLDNVSTAIQQRELCEAIRNLPSFRQFSEDLLASGHPRQVRSLLDDDAFLFQEVRRNLEAGQQKMRRLFQSVKIVAVICSFLKLSKETSIAHFAVRALTGELHCSSVVEDVSMAVKKLDSASLYQLLETLNLLLVDSSQLCQIKEDLHALVKSSKGAEPLRSEYDNHHSVMTTTVVEQQVKLRKSKKKLSKEDSEYTHIVNRFHAKFEAHFAETLIRPQDLFLHEVFLFDLKNPVKDTFAPRARFAVERVLSGPFDYLVSTSGVDVGNLSATQPITAILYQLYLESGNLVNVYDLWHAFYAIVGGQEGNNYNERMAFTLFYRALSELKLLGMVKSSRKKIDHVAKTAWKAL